MDQYLGPAQQLLYRKAKAASLLARIDRADQASKYPAHLSGGQQQRVAIARALAMGPMAMMFDESTSAFDPEMINDVPDVMVELAGDGMTMICVTHEMGFARKVTDKVIFMDKGEIIEDCSKEAFFTGDRSDRTRQLLAEILPHWGRRAIAMTQPYEAIAEAGVWLQRECPALLQALIAASRSGRDAIDRAVEAALETAGIAVERLDFTPSTVPLVDEFAPRTVTGAAVERCLIGRSPGGRGCRGGCAAHNAVDVTFWPHSFMWTTR